MAVGDLDGNTDWCAALEGVTSIIHLAGLAHVDPRRVPDPLATYRRVNTAATLQLAAAAARAGVRRFVFVSSVKVHGESSGARPLTPGDAPAPTDAYGISKLEAEQGLRAQTGPMSIAIVRPPLVYGPGVRANFLKLMDLVQRRVPLPLASVDNRRSLVAVENLSDLLIHLAVTSELPGTFLVSDGDDLSTPELIRRIAKALRVRERLLPVPPWMLAVGAKMLGKGEAAQRLLGSLQVDISQTRGQLGWHPPLSVDQAMSETAAWYRSRPTDAVSVV
jgi:nucleoside-diphosphate-sugar epimerase